MSGSSREGVCLEIVSCRAEWRNENEHELRMVLLVFKERVTKALGGALRTRQCEIVDIPRALMRGL